MKRRAGAMLVFAVFLAGHGAAEPRAAPPLAGAEGQGPQASGPAEVEAAALAPAAGRRRAGRLGEPVLFVGDDRHWPLARVAAMASHVTRLFGACGIDIGSFRVVRAWTAPAGPDPSPAALATRLADELRARLPADVEVVAVLAGDGVGPMDHHPAQVRNDGLIHLAARPGDGRIEAVALAHALGHRLGLAHDHHPGSVMSARACPGCEFTKVQCAVMARRTLPPPRSRHLVGRPEQTFTNRR